MGALAGVVWERLWTPPTEMVQQHKPYYIDYASLRRVFTGTGLYVLVAARRERPAGAGVPDS